uniref:Uncharacterized protein n=1 Tax=Anopheles maculatus TaxID=74869 RepID=A0A182SHT2_9DIPT
MAGRGRGKTNGTLTQEQLQSLGVTSKEIQAVTSAAPPPLYPPLLSKPVPLENVIENDPKTKRDGDFLWKLMPAELKPSFKRLKAVVGTTTTAKRIRSADDINAKLKALEQKESSNAHADVVKKEKSDSEDDKDGEDQDEELIDEEMDDDNDY